MGFKDFFIKKSNSETITLQQLVDFLNVGGVSSNKLSEATYFACMRVLSESVGKLPLKLLRANGQGVDKAYKHPLYSVVSSKPNPYMTATHFWSTVEYNKNHYGNAYVWIDGFGSYTNLWILPSENVQIYIDDKGIWGKENSLWYIFTAPRTGDRLKISHDNILHFKTSTSFDGITGESVRNVLKTTIEGNQKAQEMLNRSYENGFTGKAVLQYTGGLNDVSEKEYVKKIEEFVSGKSGTKNIIPMMLGTSLQPVNTKLADNEFLGLKKYSALQIAAAFGIKPNQINDYEKASYANAEAQQLAFYIDTLLYIIKQYEEELNNKLLSKEDMREGFFYKFNVSAILRVDLKTQIESLVSAVSNGLYTPDEARALLDYPAKGANELMCNGSMIPVNMIGKQYVKGGENDE